MPKATVERDFKDHYLTLQVHPDADASMIEVVYWHLARRYNAKAGSERWASGNLDDLNEAYSILATPSRRAEFHERRNSVMGDDTLPDWPSPETASPPLRVMERTRIRERSASAPQRGLLSRLLGSQLSPQSTESCSALPTVVVELHDDAQDVVRQVDDPIRRGHAPQMRPALGPRSKAAA
jgi:curved DNA-binding protein CbpA